MKQIIEMQPDHIYLIRGASTANATYFESEADCKSFLELADKYLGEYVSINCFHNNRDGWVMIITTKDEETIKAAYRKRREASTKCKPECELTMVWRILSDQVRIWLSRYVKEANQNTGRVGGRVRGKYERYIFESTEEVEATRLMMEELRYDQAQPRRRYRPGPNMSSVAAKRLRGSIYLCCKRLVSAERVRELGMKCLDLMVGVDDVLRNLVRTTLFYHFPA